jgi:hypothetical protein
LDGLRRLGIALRKVLKECKLSGTRGIHVSTTSFRLPTLLQDWRLMLTSWAADGSLSAAAREALRLDGEPAQLTALISQWAAGDCSGLPPIEVLEGSVLPGAAGAYGIRTGTIYLNGDWLASASKDRVIAVLMEELGHLLDEILHDQNSYGHMQVAGQHLSTDISAIAKSPKIPVLSPRHTRKG